MVVSSEGRVGNGLSEGEEMEIIREGEMAGRSEGRRKGGKKGGRALYSTPYG